MNNRFSGQWKPFFSPFFGDSCQWQFFFIWWKRLFQRNLPFWLVGTDFPAIGNCFFFFVHKFFLPVETVKEISERQFLKKKHIVTNVTDFLLSGNHFLRFSQTGVNCCQWKQFCLQVKHIFQPILHSGWWKRVLSQLETVLFCLKFFSASGNYYWNLGEVNFWRWNILVKY